MAFEKQMRNLYGYDIWMDWEKPRLGTTIAVFEGPDNVQILYWADPSELTKEEVLTETKALYPGKVVVLHDKIDEHQAMVPRATGGPSSPNLPDIAPSDIVVTGAGPATYPRKILLGQLGDYHIGTFIPKEVIDKRDHTKDRTGKPRKHWQR